MQSGFEPRNRKHEACHATISTIWVLRYWLRKAPILCIIEAAASMTSLRGPRVFEIRRPPEVPETLRIRNYLSADQTTLSYILGHLIPSCLSLFTLRRPTVTCFKKLAITQMKIKVYIPNILIVCIIMLKMFTIFHFYFLHEYDLQTLN